MDPNKKFKYVVYGIGAFVAFILLLVLTPFTIIDAGERGVVLKFGAVDRVLSEGIHWVTPFVEDVEKLDVKTQKEEVKAGAASKDLQNVTSVVALNYNLAPERVGDLWKNVGKNYKERIIDPAVQEAIKAATAKYTAEELITKRSQVREDIKIVLTERLGRDNIHVGEVSIVDFQFSQSFDAAIEAKVTAEQNALAAKNKLEQVKFEAEQRISQAQGEAEAIRIQAQAIQNQGGAEYVRLKTIEKWDGHLPQNLYGSAPIPFLNVTR